MDHEKRDPMLPTVTSFGYLATCFRLRSPVMPRKETTTAPITAESQQSAVSEGIDAFELPKSLVTKLAKAAIPEQSRVQKEAILALMKGSTVFINLLGTSSFSSVIHLSDTAM